MLREYQARAVDNVVNATRRTVLVAPVGAGKTIMGAEIAKRIGGRVLWLAHRRELVSQAQARVGSGVTVETIQGIRRGNFDHLIIDEAHHLAAAQWSRVAECFPQGRIVGLTATPERGDGVGLSGLFDEVVVAAQMSELQALGFLTPIKVLAPVRERVSKPDCVHAYHNHCEGLPTIIFADTVAEANRIATALGTEAITGTTKQDTRDGLIAAFRERGGVLVNVAVLTEGFDAPNTGVVILGRRFGTAGGYVQVCGRAMRPSPGKTEGLVVDLCGSSELWGYPDCDREYSLDGVALRPKLTFPPICSVCGSPRDPKSGAKCSLCDWDPKRPEAIPAEVLLAALDRAKATPTAARIGTLSRLIASGKTKGYKPAWAMIQFKLRYKSHPTREEIDAAHRLL